MTTPEHHARCEQALVLGVRLAAERPTMAARLAYAKAWLKMLKGLGLILPPLP